MSPREFVPPPPREVLEGTIPTVVYGAGRSGALVVASLKRRGIEPIAVVDRFAPVGRSCGGLEVHCLDDSADVIRGASVVVAVFNRDFDGEVVRADLRRRGARAVVPFARWFASDGHESSPIFWLDHAASVDEEIVGRTVRALSDEKSVALFHATLDARRRLDDERLPRPDERSEEYGPRDVPGFDEASTYRRVVDAGAYDGDTLEYFSGKGSMERVWAFEPDPRNFQALATRWTALSLVHATTRVDLFAAGLWSERTTLGFTSGHGESSAIEPGAEDTIDVVALDDVLDEDDEPTLIKIDVEGAEPEAIEGASRTIRRCRPRLAVSVYHRFDHVYRLIDQVVALGCDYDLYLRSFGFCGFDTLLFAVPR